MASSSAARSSPGSIDGAVSDGRVVRGNRTREKLLRAAVELFGRRGFESTSMKDLAAAAGVRAPAIYNHFPSKEHVLVAATEWALDDFQQAVIGPDDPALPAPERLEGLVTRHVLYQLEHLEFARANDLLMDADAVTPTLPTETHGEIRNKMRRHLDVMTEVLEKLDLVGDEVPARVNALAILSMCDRVLSWYRPGGRYQPADVARHYWLLVGRMVNLPAAASA